MKLRLKDNLMSIISLLFWLNAVKVKLISNVRAMFQLFKFVFYSIKFCYIEWNQLNMTAFLNFYIKYEVIKKKNISKVLYYILSIIL